MSMLSRVGTRRTDPRGGNRDGRSRGVGGRGGELVRVVGVVVRGEGRLSEGNGERRGG